MPPTQQVDMQVVNGLAAIRPVVDHQPVAIRQPQLPRYLACCGEQLAEHGRIFRRGMRVRGKVLLGNKQHMHRRLRVDIRKGQHIIILIEVLGGDGAGGDFAEEAVHSLDSTC